MFRDLAEGIVSVLFKLTDFAVWRGFFLGGGCKNKQLRTAMALQNCGFVACGCCFLGFFEGAVLG